MCVVSTSTRVWLLSNIPYEYYLGLLQLNFILPWYHNRLFRLFRTAANQRCQSTILEYQPPRCSLHERADATPPSPLHPTLTPYTDPTAPLAVPGTYTLSHMPTPPLYTPVTPAQGAAPPPRSSHHDNIEDARRERSATIARFSSPLHPTPVASSSAATNDV